LTPFGVRNCSVSQHLHQESEIFYSFNQRLLLFPPLMYIMPTLHPIASHSLLRQFLLDEE
jgi:hypothetical protein